MQVNQICSDFRSNVPQHRAREEQIGNRLGGYTAALNSFCADGPCDQISWCKHKINNSMRTTLELDDDLVVTARQLARQQGATLGQIISELARQSLATRASRKVRNGVQRFVPRAGTSKPDLRVVNAFRDDRIIKNT
jgi:hypothetical protein